MRNKNIILIVIGLALGLAAGAIGTYSWVVPAEGRDRSAENISGGAETGDEEEQTGGIIRLNETQMAGIKLHTVAVRQGSLSSSIELPGEVQWNTDRLVHVSPRVSGVVAEVAKTLGQRVEAGDLLCVLDSKPMGDAKMEYLADLGRFAVAKVDFDRARIVFENTKKLLKILDADPTPEAALSTAKDLPVGENKNKLLTSYTRLQVDRRNFHRTTELAKSNIASEADLLEAQGAFDIARADYLSTREEIAFNLRLNFLRAQKDFDLAETDVQNSERALHILGLSNKETAELAAHRKNIDTDISRNELRSPITGIIVERHLTRGELVETATQLYVIADLTDVWVMGRVYERNMRNLRKGQKAAVRLDAFPGESFEGVVDYIASQLDPDSRTVEARVVLKNPDRRFRPGMFGGVTVFYDRQEAASATIGLLVPLDAIQRVSDGYAVYRVIKPGEFEQLSVRVVAKSKGFAEVTGNLKVGDELATGDTFILKSVANKEQMGEGDDD